MNLPKASRSNVKLAVDANILVAELTRKRGRALITGEGFELFSAETPWDEAQHELAKRHRAIAERTATSLESATEQYELACRLAEANVQVIGQSLYTAFEQNAKRRIPRDPDDWHTVALALAINADIWTQDQDFLGCGVAIWTTDTLIAQLKNA